MENPFSKLGKKLNERRKGADDSGDDFLKEGDIYALLGEDEEDEAEDLLEASLQKKLESPEEVADPDEEREKAKPEREEPDQAKGLDEADDPEADPLAGLTGAERIAEAIRISRDGGVRPDRQISADRSVSRAGRRVSAGRSDSQAGGKTSDGKFDSHQAIDEDQDLESSELLAAVTGRTGESRPEGDDRSDPGSGDKRGKRTGTKTRPGNKQRSRNQIRPPQIHLHRPTMSQVMKAAAVIFVIAMFLVVKNAVDHRSYSSYKITDQDPKANNVSDYEYVDGYILRYSSDGASLLKADHETVWNESFAMAKPKVSVCDDRMLVYDQMGTSVYIYNEKGKVGSFAPPLPILKAVISKKDTIAMLLKDGAAIDFAYYRADGSQIAAGQSHMEDLGYPTDLALSPNGQNLLISYLRTVDGKAGSVLNFYNFGKAGQAQKNNLVASDRLDGVFVPEVYCLDNHRMVAVRDDGFSIYEGTDSITESKHVKFEKEIISAFHDDSHLAFIFDKGGDARYQLQLYTRSGNLISTADVTTPYSKARVCDDQILLYNQADVTIYSMKGFCRFRGTIKEGNIGDILKTGRNRYLVVTDEKMETIRLR